MPITARSVRDALDGWEPAQVTGRGLFANVSTLPKESVLGRAFRDRAKSGLLVSSLRGVEASRQRTLSTAIGASLALDVARPITGTGGHSRQLAGIGKQLAGIHQTLHGPALSASKASKAIERSSRRWANQFAVLGGAIQRFVEEQRQVDERTDAFVRRHGWPIPTSIPSRAYKRLTSLADEPKRDVNRQMTATFRPGTNAYRAARGTLEESPAFESRRPLLRQVWKAQRDGHWYLVINGLLPLVEGVLLDVMFPTGTRPQSATPGINRLGELAVDDWFGPAKAAEVLLLGGGGGSALFDRWEPNPDSETRTLNRHGVLHGSARRYGTQQNALKLFLLLVLMAECFELSVQR